MSVEQRTMPKARLSLDDLPEDAQNEVQKKLFENTEACNEEMYKYCKRWPRYRASQKLPDKDEPIADQCKETFQKIQNTKLITASSERCYRFFPDQQSV